MPLAPLLLALLLGESCGDRHPAAARPGKDHGVCYTRNNVFLDKGTLHVDALRKVVLSASSLRRAAPDLATCLFTELSGAEVVAATEATVGEGAADLFDLVLPDGFAAFEGRTAKERALLARPVVG